MSKIAINIISVVWVLAGIAGVMPAAFSVMMLDAPGSDKKLATIALVLSIMSFPLVCFFSAGIAFSSQRINKLSRAAWILLIPLINIVIGGAAIFWIERFQGGKFNG